MRDAIVLVIADKQDLSNMMMTTVVLQAIGARGPDQQPEKSGQLDVDVVPLGQMIQTCSSGGRFPNGIVSVSATDKSTGEKQSILLQSLKTVRVKTTER